MIKCRCLRLYYKDDRNRVAKIPKPLSSVQYLGAFASLSLAVGQEAGEEWQVDAVMQGQQEVICQLEARGILGQELPNTVKKEQEDWSLQGQREGEVS